MDGGTLIGEYSAGNWDMYKKLLDRITQYFTGEIDLKDFELWVVGNLQTVLDSDENEAVRAFNQVDVLLVQLDDDVISPQEFEKSLLDNVKLTA